MSSPGNKIRSIILLAILAVVLSACSHNAPAPVLDLYSKNTNLYTSSSVGQKQPRLNKQTKDGVYVVKPGDTLFSIAWHNAVDVKYLARINGVKNNIIFPGQKLKLDDQAEKPFFDSSALLVALNDEVLNKKTIPPKNSYKTAISQKTKYQNRSNKRQKSNNNLKQVKLASLEKKSSIQKTSVLNRSRTIKNNNLNWIWPTDGKILSRFSSNINANRGLDIAGKKGQAVRASAPGKVVYEGSGLKGYGNLVIIKHDDNYLSAYAHNDKVYVSENEVVKAGQRIADIGSSGTQSNKLHFEIRYKGKPVDPLNYLPNRKI